MNPVGSQFGPYKLEQRLGAGGMAETFVAVRKGPAGFEQRVCLKRVLPALSLDPAFVEQFVSEAKIAAMLRHSNVVGLVDFGEQEGTYYLALELVEGVDLRRLLRRSGSRFSSEYASIVAHDLARALAYAHEARDGRPAIVHRDVSPSNLLVSTDGDVKLADFGIAKAIQTARTTASDMIKGKVQYMAPEQMLGEQVDGGADMFSVGVVLYEMLSGRRPFDGSSDVDTMRRVIDGVRPRLDQVAPNAPPLLAELTEQLLSRRASDRPTAREVLDQLGSVAPRARQQLAAEVSAARAGVEALPANLSGPTVRLPREGETPLGATDPLGETLAAGSSLPRPPAKRSWRRPLLVLGASLAFAVAVLGYALLVGPRHSSSAVAGAEERPPTSEEPARAAASSGAHDEAAEPALAALDVPEATSEAPLAESIGDGAIVHAIKSSTRGTLRVVVVPWGEVWIDGRYMGRAPVEAVLRRGTHRVEATQGQARRRRTVVVEAASTRQVELEFD